MTPDWTPEEFALSRRIANEAEEWVLRRTVPIYAQAEGGVPQAHGTGVLLKIADVGFLVSAEHVLAEPDVELFVGAAEGLLSIGGREYGGEKGHRDFGVMRLPPELVAELANTKTFLRLDEVDPAHAPDPKGWYLVAGFPRQLSAADHVAKKITTIPWCFSTGLYPGELVNFDDGVSIALAFPPGEVFDREGERDRPPELKAISGCGMWRVIGTDEHGRGRWSPSSIRLVGIEHAVLDRKAIKGFSCATSSPPSVTSTATLHRRLNSCGADQAPLEGVPRGRMSTMSSEEEKAQGLGGVIAEEGKAVLAKAYDDAAAPSVRAAGTFLGRLTELILRVPGAFVEGGHRLIDRVEAKLHGVPPERRALPPGPVVGPAMLHYALLGEAEEVRELRDMFENLLVSAIDLETAKAVHPAFVGMLSQLSSDEAWMLKAVVDPQQDIALLDMRYVRPNQSFESQGVITLWGDELPFEETRKAQYLTNLERLGIIRLDFDNYSDAPESAVAYEELNQQMHARLPPREAWMVWGKRGMALFTPFGKQFWQTCVRRSGSHND